MIVYVRFTVLCVLGLTLTGCGSQPDRPAVSQHSKPAGPSAEGAKFVLATEPAGTQDVLAARKQTKDGEEVVVAGRIGGSKNALGKAAYFTLVDVSLPHCPPEENCPYPWDYCCTPKEVLLPATATVKFEAEGKTIAQPAKQLLGVKELDIVVVKGKAKRDEAGNMVVLGEGIYVKERHEAAPK